MYLNELLVLVVKLVTLSSEALYNTALPSSPTTNASELLGLKETALHCTWILLKSEPVQVAQLFVFRLASPQLMLYLVIPFEYWVNLPTIRASLLDELGFISIWVSIDSWYIERLDTAPDEVL